MKKGHSVSVCMCYQERSPLAFALNDLKDCSSKRNVPSVENKMANATAETGHCALILQINSDGICAFMHGVALEPDVKC